LNGGGLSTKSNKQALNFGWRGGGKERLYVEVIIVVEVKSAHIRLVAVRNISLGERDYEPVLM
jgi:hypothetical protein